MTNEQRVAIAEYRKLGYGYKKIGNLTGVCESTIKTFCRRRGLTVTAQDVETESTEEIIVKTCMCCGKQIIQYPGRKEKKFCSDVCRNKWWNSHLNLVKRKAMYEFTCPTCGKVFFAYGNRNRKYCSHECYILDRFGGGQCR